MREKMKSSSQILKRGWKGFLLAVLGLVVFSLLVPLVFLFGVNNGHGYGTEIRAETVKIDDDLSNFKPVEHSKVTHFLNDVNFTRESSSRDDEVRERGIAPPNGGMSAVFGVTPPTLASDSKDGVSNGISGNHSMKFVAYEENEKPCEIKFSSFCLWSEENKEEMVDRMMKKLKGHLFLARAYYPSIAKLKRHGKLSRELKMNIQEFERILSEATTDADLPLNAQMKLDKMVSSLSRAKHIPVDCTNVNKKLRQILELTEDEAQFHRKQSAFLYRLSVQTVPKTHHCLTMRLTVDYFRTHHQLNMNLTHTAELNNSSSHHYVIFSTNILASAVVVNSTVINAKESENLIFHIITNGQNFFAMNIWFARNSYKNATIDVLNIEEYAKNYSNILKLSHLSSSEEFRISFLSHTPTSTKMKTEYISVFDHSFFLLPEIFKDLTKVIVLHDDVLVQQDLSNLWGLNVDGKVNGAMELCGMKYGHLRNYLGEIGYNPDSCSWTSGLNVIDLNKWREEKLTEKYRKLLRARQSSQKDAASRFATLTTSFLTFNGLVYPLDPSLFMSGLGHDYKIDDEIITKAAVLHFNGDMKPWLELGIPKYKKYWSKYLNRDDTFMTECNINLRS